MLNVNLKYGCDTFFPSGNIVIQFKLLKCQGPHAYRQRKPNLTWNKVGQDSIEGNIMKKHGEKKSTKSITSLGELPVMAD